jgi:hypothetical protein
VGALRHHAVKQALRHYRFNGVQPGRTVQLWPIQSIAAHSGARPAANPIFARHGEPRDGSTLLSSNLRHFLTTPSFDRYHTHTFGLDDLERGLKILGGEVEDEEALHITVVAE